MKQHRSFDNVFDPEEFAQFMNAHEAYWHDARVYFELKIDGFKIVLTYIKGVLITAATRGDGVVGEK